MPLFLCFFETSLVSYTDSTTLKNTYSNNCDIQKHGGTLVCHLLIIGKTRVQIPARDKSVIGPVLFALFVSPLYDLESLVSFADDNYTTRSNKSLITATN